MRDYAYSSEQVFSGDRWALAGEAGVFLDPFYSPGLRPDCHQQRPDRRPGRPRTRRRGRRRARGDPQPVFFLLTDGWLTIYENQYPLMGNARVMSCKVMWDTAVLLGGPGPALLPGRLSDARRPPRPAEPTWPASRNYSEHVQRFYRDWRTIAQSDGSEPVHSYYDFDFMARLHIGMTAGLEYPNCKAQFKRNVRFLEQLAGQLVATVIAEFEARWPRTPVRMQIEALARRRGADVNLVRIYEADTSATRSIAAGSPWATADSTIGGSR